MQSFYHNFQITCVAVCYNRGVSIRQAVSVGKASVQENLIPMFVLWLAAAAAALLYWRSAAFQEMLGSVVRLQVKGGYAAAFLNRLVFCGIVPGAFILALPRLRPRRRALAVVLLTALWCGVWGMVCDGFYRLQQDWFGAEARWSVVILKTLVDQFVFNVLVIAPSSAAFYFWTANALDFGQTLRRWPRDWIMTAVLPNLVTSWCVNIPVFLAIYMFPHPLQVQLSGLAASFWTLVSLGIGRGILRR